MLSVKDRQGSVNKATEPTPARRALDGPELPEPSEAEVESEIQRLLTNQDDTEPPTELTLVSQGSWARGSRGRGRLEARGPRGERGKWRVGGR